MTGRRLLQLLLKQRGLNPNSLSAALGGESKQPQIQKFLAGTSREPRRSTLAPIARYFGLPVEAFYDEDLAQLIADQNGFTPEVEEHFAEFGYGGAKGTEHRQVVNAPIPISAQNPPPSIRATLQHLCEVLAQEPLGVRRSVVAILSDMAEHVDDATFTAQMIERVMGALGQQGNDQQRKSTPFPQRASGDK